MAKTRRRPSYRKAKRWNPGSKRRGGRGRRRNPYARPNENEIPTRIIRRPGHRNPGAFTRYLGDGNKVTVSDDGQGRGARQGRPLQPLSHRPRARLAHFIRDLQKPAKRSDKYDYQGEGLKDEGSYSVSLNPGRRKGRGHRGHKRKSRARSMNHELRYERGAAGKKWRKGRKAKTRRNPRIKRREAKAISRVLKRHGYRCAGKRRSRRARR